MLYKRVPAQLLQVAPRGSIINQDEQEGQPPSNSSLPPRTCVPSPPRQSPVLPAVTPPPPPETSHQLYKNIRF